MQYPFFKATRDFRNHIKMEKLTGWPKRLNNKSLKIYVQLIVGNSKFTLRRVTFRPCLYNKITPSVKLGITP